MLSSRAIVAAAALGAVLPLAGCGGSQRTLASLDGLSAGTTTLRVANHVGAPEQLDQLTIAVDGQTLPLSPLPPAGADPSTIGTLRLPPGAHSIAVRAVLRAEPERAGAVRVAFSQHPFRVERGPALIGIDVRSSGELPASPASLRLTMVGGLLAPGAAFDDGIPQRVAGDDRCASLEPVPRALCRASLDLDEAAKKNDVVASLCLRDKIAEMQKLAGIGASESAPLADARAVFLARQAEHCVGDAALSPVPDGLTVTRPSAP